MSHLQEPERTEPVEAEETGWVFMPLSAIPERWSHRAKTVAMVPLVPEEARALLQEGSVSPMLSREEEQIASLVAAGKNAEQISSELYIASRSVYRKLERMKRMFGVETRSELISQLARLGF